MPPSWNRARIAPGRVAYLALSCPPPHTIVFASVNNQQYLYLLSAGTVFGQARIGVEFGATPWTHASFRSPHKAFLVAKFRPASPAPLRGRDRDGQRVWGGHCLVVGASPGADDRRLVRQAPGGHDERAVGPRLRVHRLP